MIASSESEVKADGVRKLEGSRPGYVMASVEVTTGVNDQGMHARVMGGDRYYPAVLNPMMSFRNRLNILSLSYLLVKAFLIAGYNLHCRHNS